MRPLRFLRFAVWFALHDLFERVSRRTTNVVLVNVGLLCGFSLFVFGVTYGLEAVGLDRLENQAHALSLWVGDGKFDRPVDEQKIENIRARLAERFHDPRPLEGHLFDSVEDVRIVTWGEGKDGGHKDYTGRTLAPGDPFLDRMPTRFGRRFRDPDAKGIVVTPLLLKQLKAPADPPPDELLVILAGGRPRPVKVLDVTVDEQLPMGQLFVVPEAFLAELRRVEPNPPTAEFVTGPIPDDWPREVPKVWTPGGKLTRDQHDRLREVFGNNGLRFDDLAFPPIRAAERDGRAVWKLTGDVQRVREAWLPILSGLNGVMKEDFHLKDGGDAFLHVWPTDVDMKALMAVNKVEKKKAFAERAGLYFRKLHYLRAGEEASLAEGLPVYNRDVIAQLEDHGRSAGLARVALLVLVAFFGGLAYLNVGAVQGLRMRQKTAEIGMLRAIGIGRRLLWAVCVAEAAAIWVVAVGAGCLGGYLFGLGLPRLSAALPQSLWDALPKQAAWLRMTPREVPLAFDCPWYLTAAILLLAALACYRSTMKASRAARKASPVEALAQT